jgi:adenine specific DNA methylase Mod
VVLDLFAGSGNTGRAALACGRKAILVDVDISWMQEHPIGELEFMEGKTPYRMEVIE